MQNVCNKIHNTLTSYLTHDHLSQLIPAALWRRDGLMVSVLASRSSDPDSSLGQGHRVVFLGKTLYSHSGSLNPGV